MNIYLVPYTWVRHYVVALSLAGAALMAWWAVEVLVVSGSHLMYSLGFLWRQMADGMMLLCALGGTVAFGSLLAEGSLRRRALHWRLLYAIGGSMITVTMIAVGYTLYWLLLPYLGTEEYLEIRTDPSLVSLRYTMFQWMWAGFASGFGPFFVRRFSGVLARFGLGADKIDLAALAKKAGMKKAAKELKHVDAAIDAIPPPDPPTWGEFFSSGFFHCLGGLVASLAAAAIWHTLGHYPAVGGDLYLGSALAAIAWGGMYGLLVWPIPDDLYAGWIRVLSAERYGLRIPIDRPNDQPSERFVGHFPRGLDMYLPADQGVAELHTSFVVDKSNNYAVRGLSQQPTTVHRFLEKIDLRYDPRRPAPLETTLKMEDRVYMGNGDSECTVEFLLLPKEEM